MRRRRVRRCCWSTTATASPSFAALAHYPSFAWATEDGPGACDYHGNKARIFARIAALRDEVDVIAVELQHEEIYNPAPIFRQVQDFRELRAAGVDIVTGVQSHVPQAMEPYGYGNERARHHRLRFGQPFLRSDVELADAHFADCAPYDP